MENLPAANFPLIFRSVSRPSLTREKKKGDHKMDEIELYHKRNSEKFDELYPELEDIEIYYDRHDRYASEGTKTHTPRKKQGFIDGKYVECSDKMCRDKYNLYGHIASAIKENKNEIEIRNFGKERLDSNCERTTSFWVKLIYKKINDIPLH